MDAIDFLERIGADARIRYGSEAELELALAESAVGSGLEMALIGGDGTALYRMLGQGVQCVMQIPADEEEDETPDEDEDGAAERLPNPAP